MAYERANCVCACLRWYASAIVVCTMHCSRTVCSTLPPTMGQQCPNAMRFDAAFKNVEAQKATSDSLKILPFLFFFYFTFYRFCISEWVSERVPTNKLQSRLETDHIAECCQYSAKRWSPGRSLQSKTRRLVAQMASMWFNGGREQSKKSCWNGFSIC